MMDVVMNFHKDGHLIQALKTKRYKNAAYLAWLRRQKCYSCPSRGQITASHVFRGYYGLTNHDWGAVPMCGVCHWTYEYHKDWFVRRWHLPSAVDAESYFARYLGETCKKDDRTEEQRVPL
jgi:hypothetical protein